MSSADHFPIRSRDVDPFQIIEDGKYPDWRRENPYYIRNAGIGVCAAFADGCWKYTVSDVRYDIARLLGTWVDLEHAISIGEMFREAWH